MEANLLPPASLIDIIFEGRNKAYGAYQLRRQYPQQVIKALGISLSGVFLFLACCYAAVSSGSDPVPKELPAAEKETITLLPVINLEKAMAAVPAPVEPPAPKAAATRAFKEFRVVAEPRPVAGEIPSQAELVQTEPGLITTVGEVSEKEAPEMGAATGQGLAADGEITQPFVHVEQMPEFPGGLTALYKFIGRHLRYPPAALTQGLEGNVILSFVIDATGQLSEITIIKDIGGGAGEEAKRVIAKMPNWRPGIQNKQAVPVRFTLPIRFAREN